MTPRYRKHLAFWRKCGFDIFVIPGPGFVSGMAFCSLADKTKGLRFRRYINMRGSTYSTIWLFVLFHEIAHHALRHTNRWTSTPTWLTEYEADQFALELVMTHWPAAWARCEREARDHIRPMLQDRLDHGLWYNTDLGIARWAGCTIPEETDSWPVPSNCQDTDSSDDDLPF